MDITDEIIKVEHKDGSVTTFTGYDVLIVKSIRDLGAEKALDVLGFRLEDVNNAFKQKTKSIYALCIKNLRCRSWKSREFGYEMTIDDDFLQEIFDIKVKKRAFYKHLKEQKADIDTVIEINKFCENELYR